MKTILLLAITTLSVVIRGLAQPVIATPLAGPPCSVPSVVRSFFINHGEHGVHGGQMRIEAKILPDSLLSP